MNLDSIFSKIANKADLIGTVFGAGAFGFDYLLAQLSLLPNIHAPDIAATINDFINGPAMKPKIQSTIMLWVTGYVAKEAGFSQGRAVQDFAEGYAKGLGIVHLLYWMTHSHPGETAGIVSGTASTSASPGYAY